MFVSGLPSTHVSVEWLDGANGDDQQVDQSDVSEWNEMKFCYISHWGWVALAALATVVALAVLPLVFAPKVAIYSLVVCAVATGIATVGAVMSIYTKLRYDYLIKQHQTANQQPFEATVRDMEYKSLLALTDPHRGFRSPVFT